MLTGKTKLQYFNAHCKSSKNGQLNPTSANPYPLPVSNVSKSWGFNSDFPRRMFIKHYFQTYHKELNGNNHLPKKEGFGDRSGTNKRYGLNVIENADFPRSIFTPYCFYEKKVIHNKNDKTGDIGDNASPDYLCAANKSAKELW